MSHWYHKIFAVAEVLHAQCSNLVYAQMNSDGIYVCVVSTASERIKMRHQLIRVVE